MIQQEWKKHEKTRYGTIFTEVCKYFTQIYQFESWHRSSGHIMSKLNQVGLACCHRNGSSNPNIVMAQVTTVEQLSSKYLGPPYFMIFF